MEGSAVKMLCSNGKSEARAYATAGVRLSTPAPEVEIERVQIVNPRHTLTMPSGVPCGGSAPRNPEQKVLALPRHPGIELPDRRPATKAQRVFIDPELAAQWRAEAMLKETA
jgi:hypothetical protein